MSDYGKANSSQRIFSPYKKGPVYAYIINACFGGLFFGYVMSNYNIVSDFADSVGYNSTISQGFSSWVTSVVPLGAGAGALLTGKIASTVGRKKTMILTDIIALIGTILSLLPSPILLLIGRLVQGYSVGANSGIVPLYISEIAPVEAGGAMGTLNQFSITFGVLIAPVLGFALPTPDNDPGYVGHTGNQVFRVILGVAAIFAILRLIGTLFIFNMETPAYLVSVGKDSEALEILNNIYDSERAHEELGLLKRRQEAQAQAGQMTVKDIFSKKYGKRVFIGAMMSIFQQFAGINAIIFFSTKIFNGDTTSKLVSTLIMDFMQMASSFVSGLVIERFGRRLLFVGGMGVLSTLLIVFGFIYISVSDSPVLKFLIWAYMIAFGLSAGPVPWVYIADILPDMAVGVAVLANWMSAFVIGLGFTPVVNGLGLQWGFWIFAIITIIGVAFGVVVMKETKGKSKVQIDDMFANGRESMKDLTSSLQGSV